MHLFAKLLHQVGHLQVVGPICTHLSSYCTKLSILKVVEPIYTHLISYCMVGAIYSLFLWTFKFASILAITLNPNLQWLPGDLLGIESERED